MTAAEYRTLIAGGRSRRSEAGSRAAANGRAWEEEIEASLDLGGWTWVHNDKVQDVNGRWRTGLRGKKGHPDYLIIHPARGLFHPVEAKSADARLSKDQQGWKADYAAAGIEVLVWRPEDRAKIHAYLRGRS